MQRREELRARDLPAPPLSPARGRPVTLSLRTRPADVAQAAGAHDAATPPDPASVLATIRQRKNEYT